MPTLARPERHDARGVPIARPTAMDVSVVMPCLNEARTVGGCVDQAFRGLAAAGVRGEVIVADNGSADGSPAGARVLDVGCFQGEFFDRMGERIGPSVGFDPLALPRTDTRHQVVAERFGAGAALPDGTFDAVVILATLEHIQDKAALAREFFRVLRPGGRVVVTVPAAVVDRIVAGLVWLRVADGMSLEEHHGYDPAATPVLFESCGFALEHRARFQLGLNHLYVFRKPPAGGSH